MPAHASQSSSPTPHQSSCSRTPPSVIPDIFNRESRAFAFSFFLDAGSESGMTVESANRHSRESGNPGPLPFPFFLDAGSGSGMTVEALSRHSYAPSVAPAHAPFVIPANAGIQGLCFSFFLDAGSGSGMTVGACGFSSGCRIKSGMTDGGLPSLSRAPIRHSDALQSVIPAKAGIQGRCLFFFSGCRIESGMTVRGMPGQSPA